MNSSLFPAVFIAAATPLLLLSGVLVVSGRADPDRAKGLAGMVVAGALGSTALALSLSALLFSPPSSIGLFSDSVFVSPLLEEASKATALLVVLRWAPLENRVDGLLYGAAVGVGFGITENLLYLLAESFLSEGLSALWLVLGRTFLPTTMHATASGLVGLALFRSHRQSKLRRARTLSIGLIGAIALHSLWNMVALA